MVFEAFLALIPKISKITLPGNIAHSRMEPMERAAIMRNLDPETLNPKKAAVMMLCYPKDGAAYLVLTLRNTYPGVHSSQVSFPGGKREASDIDFQMTALRETQEEIGIDPSQIKVVRAFSELYIPPSNFMVYPFLGYCDEPPVFTPDPTEVAQILELPLADFLDDTLMSVRNMDTSYNLSINVPGFIVHGNMVWGATAMILSELKEVLKVSLQNT